MAEGRKIDRLLRVAAEIAPRLCRRELYPVALKQFRVGHAEARITPATGRGKPLSEARIIHRDMVLSEQQPHCNQQVRAVVNAESLMRLILKHGSWKRLCSSGAASSSAVSGTVVSPVSRGDGGTNPNKAHSRRIGR
jgi:hypothetical protein